MDECIAYLCEYITKNGPFDGLLGFSQGATLSGLLLGYQAQGKLLKDHPPFKLFVSISGTKFRDSGITEIANKDPIKTKSVHFIGAKDHLKVPAEEFATAFVDPLVIRHPGGHLVPRLGALIDFFLLLFFFCCMANFYCLIRFGLFLADEVMTEQIRNWVKELEVGEECKDAVVEETQVVQENKVEIAQVEAAKA